MKNKIDDLKKNIQANTKEFIALQSLLTSCKAMAPENGGDGEKEKCDLLESWLFSHGVKNLEHFDAPDSRVSSKIRPNLVATIEGEKNDYALWFIAHMDVVPSGDLNLWETNPWEVVEKDGKLFGRGVEDNQQGLVSAVGAALAFTSLKIKPSQTVKLLFVSDEEVGSSYGLTYLLKNHNLFSKNDIIIIPDGGDSKGETIEIAEKNLLWMELEVLGKQCHGSRPDEGKNSCLAAADFTMRLNNLENVFNAEDKMFTPPISTFQPTMRKANVDGVNIIPGKDIFYMDCRILPCYKTSSVIEEVEKQKLLVEEKYGVKINISYPQRVESLATPKDSAVVKKLSAAIKLAQGIDSYTIGIGGGTVGAELRNLGYDCAVWGTLDERCHTPNEYCVIANMIKDAETMATLMATC